MDAAQIAAMIADRESGTPGPWKVDGPVWNQIVWTDNENRLCFMAHSNGLNDGRDEANARRIARVPDMEAHIIAQAAELERLRAALDDERTFLDRAVSKSPQPLADLGKYLADLLDEDDWPTAERYLNAAVVEIERQQALKGGTK